MKNCLFQIMLIFVLALSQGCKDMSSLTANSIKSQNSGTTTTTDTGVLTLNISGPTSLTAGQCRSYVLRLQTVGGINKNAAATLAVTLGGAGSGNFYAGTNCSGGPISSINIATGASFNSFSYKNSTAENVNMVATAPVITNVQEDIFSLQVNAILTTAPTQIVLSGPSSVMAGACSGPVVVRTVDASYNSAATATALSYTITGGAGFSVFTDAGCSSSLTTPNVAANTSSSSFYFIVAGAGNFVIAADDSGSLTDGSLSVQATATTGTTAVKFTIAGPASVKAADCSAAYVVKTTNGSGIDAAVSATTTVNISGKGTGDFYADAACSSVISSLVFASGDSSKPFYYKGASVANLTFNVDDAGPLTPASTTVSIVPDVPTQLVVTGQSPISLGECRAYTVTSKDVNNFISTVASTTSVNLTGAGTGTFYSDSSCIMSTSSVIINSGQSSSLFYYKAIAASSVTLSADNSGGLTAGTKAVTVDPLPYTKVVFSRPALTAGTCSAVTLTLKDSLNNTSAATSAVGVTLASNGGAAFHSTSNCVAGVITSATITTGQTNTTVYLQDNVAENITLGATSTGLTSDSWNSTVASGAVNTIALTGPATNAVGSCNAYDLKLQDALGNLATAVSPTSINFTGLSNAKFYSDSGCATIANSATIASSSSQAQIYFKGNVAEALTVGATSGSLVAASKSISLITGTSNKIIINGSAVASAGACTALSVEIQDSFNNPIVQGSSVPVTMSGNGSGSYYSDAGCTAAASVATVASGASSATIYFKSNVPASLSFVAQATGLFDGAKSFSINPLAPTKLVMTGSSSISSGVCTAYSISLQDTLNNLSSAGSAKTLNFSGALAGAFYSDSSCSLSAASISLSASQTTAQIYYKASVAQTPNLSVDDSGLPDLVASTLPVTVTSSGGGVAIALKISGSTSINSNTCVPYAVMTTDASGLSYSVTSNMTVTMAGAGTGAFYSNSGCTVASSTVVISSGTSLSYIYFQSASAQNLVFSSTATGASATTLPVAVVSGGGGGATRLTLAGSTSILTNSCIPYVLSVADTNGNSTNATANTTITLSGEGSGDFYTNNTCTTTAAGTATVTSGTSFTRIYYKNAAPQNLIFVAQSTGLSNGTLSVATSSTSAGATAGPAVKLTFAAQPSAIASANENFGEQPIVLVQDSNNNVSSASAATITLAAYTDSACTMSAGSILVATTNPLNASGGVANFAGVNVTSAQALYLKATSPGLASACSSAIQVYPSVPAKLSFTRQPSTTGTAGVNLTVQPQVSVLNYTNQVVTNAINSVSISAFTDSNCSITAPGVFNLGINNVIPTSGVVTFSGINYSVASTIYLKATSGGLTSSCSSGITVSPAPAYQVGVYYQPAASGKAGDLFSLTARLYDSFGNPSLQAHNLTLTAYKSTNCSGSTSSITGGSATSVLGTATFSSIVFSEASTMSLKVSDATNPTVLETCSAPIIVDGGAPAKLVFSTQPSSAVQIYVSLSTPPAVMVQDAFNNKVSSSTNAVTISAYTDSGCTTTPAPGTLTATNLTVSPTGGISTFGSVTYSNTGVIYLKAASAGLTSVCSNAITLVNLSTKISTKGGTSCGVLNGGVKCWGYNAGGQLGDSSLANNPYPSEVLNTAGTAALSNITDVAVGTNFACALSNAGAVYCWGLGTTGQLGDNAAATRNYPVQVKGVGGTGTLTNIVAISAGDIHACAVTNAGAVYCWGGNSQGQLGDNTTSQRNSPVQVLGVGAVSTLASVTAINVGDLHSCAATSAGAAYCWGYNGYGQLGDNTTTQRLTPIQVKGVGGTGTLASVTSITTGNNHSCATNVSGAAYCWGSNASGQLGDNSTTQRNVPVQVVGVAGSGNLTNSISISAGGINTSGYTCAVNAARTVFCWGYNNVGQLGDNSTTPRTVPVQVLGVGAIGNLTNIISVSIGNYNTCALSDDGYMYCWGYNNTWQLGDQTTTNRSTPVKVKENSNTFTSVSNAGTGHACGISNEKVYCWGNNAQGQLGDGTTTSRSLPTLVSTLNGVKQVSTLYLTTCAVLNTGAVYCWGQNDYGQLGDGTTTNRSTPVQVSGLSNATYVSTSHGHSCAVTTSGAAYCWGLNQYGELGNNSTSSSNTPVLVSGGLNFVSIAASSTATIWTTNGHTCGITNTGAAYCWGRNTTYNQLGDGTATDRFVPTAVSGLSSGVTAIESYEQATCAIQSGALRCWGYFNDNTWSTYSFGSTPMTTFGSGVTSMSVTLSGICAVVSGSVTCFHPTGNPAGYMTYVQNGNNLKDIKSISMGYYSNSPSAGNIKICVLKNNGVLYCWGQDSYAVHNFGTVASTASPSIIAIPPSSSNTLTGVAVGESHSCGILNGITQCWGTSTSGALGTGTTTSLTPSPVLLASNSSFLISQTSVGAGGTHTCSLSNIGEVFCWGENAYGKLGNNSTVASPKAIKVLGEGGIGTLLGVTSLAVGYRHNCVVISGAVYCWGYNTNGQLGIDSTMTMGTATKVVGVGGSGYFSGAGQVVAGRAHTCTIKSGNVYCWGSNQYGQLGANSAVPQSNTPLQVVSVSGVGTLNNVTALAAGAYHTCALASGITYCWGANGSQQLGNGTTQDSSYPVGVANSDLITLNGVTSISAGFKHNCAITSIGETYCWGSGTFGQLGLNSGVDTGAATKVVGLGGAGILSANMVATGSSANHSCAISTDQTNIYCWGAGSNGQMGNGASPAAQLYPVPFTYSSILYLLVR